VGRFVRLAPLLAAVAIPAAGAANPPQVAFKRTDDPPGIWLVDQTGGGAVELTRGQPKPTSLGTFSWSPDGARIAYASGDPLWGGDLYALAADGGQATRLTSDGRNEHPSWSPDGSRIAYIHGFQAPREVWLLDVGTGDRRPLTGDGGLKEGVSWSPDGSRIAYAGSGGSVVVDVASGRRVLELRGVVAWSPDGARFAVADDKGISVLDLDDGDRRVVAAGADAGDPRWSSDGSRIAFVRWHCIPGLKGLCSPVSSVYEVGADGRGERRLTGPIAGGPGAVVRGHPNDSSAAPAWWPDGSRIFFRRSGQAFVMNADGTCEQPFGPQKLLLGAAAWRPGSQPSLPPLRCADVRVRAGAARRFYGTRDRPKIRIVVENDGNETATGLVVSVRVARGRGRARPPSSSCRGVGVVRCPLPPLAAGRSRELTVSFTRTKGWGFEARVSATARDSNSGRTPSAATVNVAVLDCDVVGTDGADRLVGTPRRDTMCGLPGDDRILAGAGDDTITAGAGADTIRPGPGPDTVFGGEGRERVYARDGTRDVIYCGPFLDTVVADRFDRLVGCERVSR
jgi:hypothetical protein